MKVSLLLFRLAAFAGGLVALTARSPAVRAAGCSCTASVICGTHFASLVDAGQGQNCCNAPNNPTDKLFFTITRQTSSACTKGKLIATDTSGATCDIGSGEWEPDPAVGIQRCWDGNSPVSYTETYLIQRCCDADDGSLTVEFRELGGTRCGSPEINVFSSAQTALCGNCVNPGVCTDPDMCTNC